MTEYLYVRNWRRFQHYRHRSPPWVKLHWEMLTSVDWVLLADASKLLMVVCTMIAGRYDGRVPNSPAYIKRIAGLERLPNLKPLIDCGFLSETLAPASAVQAPASALRTNAPPETETEKEEETEEVRTPSLRDGGARTKKTRGTRLPESYEPDLVDARLLGLSDAQAVSEAAKFKDHFAAATGQRGVKLDWRATWRNWCRRANEMEGKVNGHRVGNAGKRGSHDALLRAVAEQFATGSGEGGVDPGADVGVRHHAGPARPAAGPDLELTPDDYSAGGRPPRRGH